MVMETESNNRAAVSRERRGDGAHNVGREIQVVSGSLQQQSMDVEDDSASTWAIMLDIWPLEDRPEKMTNPQIVNKFSFDQMVKYKKSYEALQKREGKGEGVFGKDSAIPTKRFQQADDNCADLLHPARYEIE
jgi:hypothetical protein